MRKTKPSTVVFLILSILGFLDATYLTIEHYLGSVPKCVVVNGCEKVLTSQWNQLFGIPISLFGALYYLFVLILTITYMRNNNWKFLLSACGAVTLGFLFSLRLVYLQIFVIEQICFYCAISALITTGLFITALFLSLAPRPSGVRTEQVQ